MLGGVEITDRTRRLAEEMRARALGSAASLTEGGARVVPLRAERMGPQPRARIADAAIPPRATEAEPEARSSARTSRRAPENAASTASTTASTAASTAGASTLASAEGTSLPAPAPKRPRRAPEAAPAPRRAAVGDRPSGRRRGPA